MKNNYPNFINKKRDVLEFLEVNGAATLDILTCKENCIAPRDIIFSACKDLVDEGKIVLQDGLYSIKQTGDKNDRLDKN